MYDSTTTVTVGLDVHARSIQLAAIRADELLEERTLPYDLEAVESRLRRRLPGELMPTTIDRSDLQRLVSQERAQLVAWLLESIGFERVYDCVAGKAGWDAAGLPLKGTAGPGAGEHARRDVPTCRLDERLVDMQTRVRASGWDTWIVVNDQGVVLGRSGDPNSPRPEPPTMPTSHTRPGT